MEAVSVAEASAWDRAASQAPPVFPERTPSGRYTPPCDRSDGPRRSCTRAINDGFGNGARYLSRHRPEIFTGFRAKRNRSVPVVENPVSRKDLPVFPVLGRDAILLGLRKVVPYRRPIHGSYCSIIGYNGKPRNRPGLLSRQPPSLHNYQPVIEGRNGENAG